MRRRCKAQTIHFRNSPSAKFRCASMASDAAWEEPDRMAARISECWSMIRWGFWTLSW